MGENKDILFRINDINQKKFSLYESNDSSFDSKNLLVSYGTKYSPNIEQNIFKIGIRVKYSYKKDSGDLKELLYYEVSIAFEIKDLKDYVRVVDKKDNMLDINDALLTKLLNIAFSLVRGMLVVKTEHTFLKKLYFPFVQIPKLLDSQKEGIDI